MSKPVETKQSKTTEKAPKPASHRAEDLELGIVEDLGNNGTVANPLLQKISRHFIFWRRSGYIHP